MSAGKEALKSNEPDVVKHARGKIKVQVTIGLKKLEALLTKVDDRFNHNQISELEVTKYEKRLKEHFELFDSLHQRYCFLRPVNDDDAIEMNEQEVDLQYFEEVENKYNILANLYVDYSNSLAKFKEEQKKMAKLQSDLAAMANKEPSLRKKFEFDLVAYNACINSALAKLNRFTDEQKKANIDLDFPADRIYSEVKDKFQLIDSSYRDLNEAMISKGDEAKSTLNFSLELESLKVNDLLTDLLSAENCIKNAKSKSGSPISDTVTSSKSEPSAVKVSKIDSIKFSGEPRDFSDFCKEFKSVIVPHRSKAEIGIYLRQAVPVQHRHLLDNIELDDWELMMDALKEKFGTSKLVTGNVLADLRKIKVVTSDKGFVDFVEKVQRAERNMKAVGLLDQLSNAVILNELESKLPHVFYMDWGKKVEAEKLNKGHPSAKFTVFMDFLKSCKNIVEDLSLSQDSGSKCTVQTNLIIGPQGAAKPALDVSGAKPSFQLKPCLACYDGSTNGQSVMHDTKDCEVWASMNLKDRQDKVNCHKHPFSTNGHLTKDCKNSLRKPCVCGSSEHHVLLCPKFKTNSPVASIVKVSNTVKEDVLLKTIVVKGASQGQVYGCLQDNASTDNFITHKKAKSYNLLGHNVAVEIEGINNIETYQTMLYKVPIKTLAGEIVTVECFGLDSIASNAVLPNKKDYEILCEKFGVSSCQAVRPKQIDMLLSQREAYLMSDKVKKVCGNMKLYTGPLGFVLSGSDPSLVFGEHKLCYPSVVREISSHLSSVKVTAKFSKIRTKSDKEILSFFEYEDIGVQSDNRRKMMTLKDQREYEKFKDNMLYDELGTSNDPGPYWRVTYPWEKPREVLPNNFPAVLGVMNSTARKLDKNIEWRKIYEKQLLDLVQCKFAREISVSELSSWQENKLNTYYIAHQMVVDPTNKSTPIRTVFNSSQVYKGHSLNTSWSLGPDIMSELQGVLLRFREDYVAAQGDIKKMFYSVRVSPEDERMQLFIWKFLGEDKIRTFAMSRLVMGNKPSSNISIIALKETTKLKDNASKFPNAYEALNDNSYVDNTFIGADTLEELHAKIVETENIACQGGFFFKPWVVSGMEIEDQLIGAAENVSESVEKALGVQWMVRSDMISVRVSLELGNKRSPKAVSLVPQLGLDCRCPELIRNPGIKLSLRICLSIHAKTFDPLGWFLPTKMVGNLLFRETLQYLNSNSKGPIQWDVELSDKFVQEWESYFRMLHSLADIKIPRCVKPVNIDASVKPILVTFSDGNMDAYGSVAYGLWKRLDGSKAAMLLVAKARLGPILHKGETVKNELSGAVSAARLKCWVEDQSGIEFAEHIPFLDSRIVQDMILKDSYQFNTFAGLRVDELQRKTNPEDWLHIPSEANYCADILTKGETPDKLGPDSVWQKGPQWLIQNTDTWPIVKSRSLLTAEEYETVHKFKKVVKSKFSINIHSSYTFKSRVRTTNVPQIPIDSFDQMLARCGSIDKVLRVTAYILRLGGRDKPSTLEISAKERHDAWLTLIYWEQMCRLDKRNYPGLIFVDRSVELSFGRSLPIVMLAARHKNHKEIPFIPCGVLAKLIVMHHHNRYHVDIDDTVVHVRNEVWIPKVRKYASSLEKNCKICLLKRKKMASQLMGDLPDCRVEPSPAFQSVCMDLFGPLIIRDDCVKKGPRVSKKVWGVVLTCTASRAVYLDVAIDYSTEAILHVLRRFMADRGDVRLIISDPGTQLVGASKELREVRRGWSSDELVRFGAQHSIEWTTVMPSSQHQNGAAEIVVKLVKGIMSSLLASIGTSILSLNELNTLLKEAANICNERPIGLRPNSVSDQEYLAPNSLLLGRSSTRISAGPFQSKDVYDERPKAMKTRFLFVQRIVDSFWKNWTKSYLPTLIVRQKWHHLKRNLSCGDICLVEDQNALRGDWRIGRIINVFPDKHKIVRNVELLVAQKFDGNSSYRYRQPSVLKRHASRVILLVPCEVESQEVSKQSLLPPAGSEKLSLAQLSGSSLSADPKPVLG